MNNAPFIGFFFSGAAWAKAENPELAYDTGSPSEVHREG